MTQLQQVPMYVDVVGNQFGLMEKYIVVQKKGSVSEDTELQEDFSGHGSGQGDRLLG